MSLEEYIKKIEPVIGKEGEGLKLWFSDIFDLSYLPKNHPCSHQSHRKCFGYMKLENKGKPIDYFVVPFVKGYLEQIGQKVKVKLKGVTESQRKELTRENFIKCVMLLLKGPQVSFQGFRIPDEHGVNTNLTIKETFKFFQPKVYVPEPEISYEGVETTIKIIEEISGIDNETL